MVGEVGLPVGVEGEVAVEARSYAVLSGTSSAGAVRSSTGKLIRQPEESTTRRTSRITSGPAARGTAYSISRKRTSRVVVNTRCATSL